jgi:hypothetical protein
LQGDLRNVTFGQVRQLSSGQCSQYLEAPHLGADATTSYSVIRSRRSPLIIEAIKAKCRGKFSKVYFQFRPGRHCAILPSNVRDQRRRAVGAPLANVALKTRRALLASGVTTSDDRCIA